LNFYDGFPIKEMVWEDCLSTIAHPIGFKVINDLMLQLFKNNKLIKESESVVVIESKGFIYGTCLAHSLNKGVVTVRKKGKLPGEKYYSEFNM
jgi:adenine phosphoribosyltransferase